jgi:PucR C-terminal helix-turn-helix domain/GGDEF-like domain
MTGVHHSPLLQRTLAELAECGVLPQAATALAEEITRIGPALRQAVLAEVPAFSASGNPAIGPELDHHVDEHVNEIRRLLGGGAVDDFDFVKTHAERRAEQRFPLEAVLHAYRCGHKVLSHWIRDAAMAVGPSNLERAISAVADFAIEYTNAISIVSAAAYVAHTRFLAEAEGDLRTELLNVLLSGFDESDARVARLLKRAGYLEQRQAFCVAVARSNDPLEMENSARAQRLAEAMVKAVASLSVRVLVGNRNNVVTAVFSDTRRLSGWTAPRASLADRIRSPLLTLGPAVLIGLSNDQPSTAYIPRALHEATVALDFAKVSERVVQFAALPIRRLLVHRAAEYLHAALPTWVEGFSDADAKARGALVDTLRAYANADMNVQSAARALDVHPNTVYTRLQRINALTGLDAQRFHDLTELLLAADCRKT